MSILDWTPQHTSDWILRELPQHAPGLPLKFRQHGSDLVHSLTCEDLCAMMLSKKEQEDVWTKILELRQEFEAISLELALRLQLEDNEHAQAGQGDQRCDYSLAVKLQARESHMAAAALRDRRVASLVSGRQGEQAFALSTDRKLALRCATLLSGSNCAFLRLNLASCL